MKTITSAFLAISASFLLLSATSPLAGADVGCDSFSISAVSEVWNCPPPNEGNQGYSSNVVINCAGGGGSSLAVYEGCDGSYLEDFSYMRAHFPTPPNAVIVESVKLDGKSAKKFLKKFERKREDIREDATKRRYELQKRGLPAGFEEIDLTSRKIKIGGLLGKKGGMFHKQTFLVRRSQETPDKVLLRLFVPHVKMSIGLPIPTPGPGKPGDGGGGWTIPPVGVTPSISRRLMKLDFHKAVPLDAKCPVEFFFVTLQRHSPFNDRIEMTGEPVQTCGDYDIRFKRPIFGRDGLKFTGTRSAAAPGEPVEGAEVFIEQGNFNEPIQHLDSNGRATIIMSEHVDLKREVAVTFTVPRDFFLKKTDHLGTYHFRALSRSGKKVVETRHSVRILSDADLTSANSWGPFSQTMSNIEDNGRYVNPNGGTGQGRVFFALTLESFEPIRP